jgi:hypothetical protein
MERAPEAIAGMGVVMTEIGGPLSGGGADEDEAEVRLKLVGEFVQRVRPLPLVHRTGYLPLSNNSTLKVSDDVIVDGSVELHEIK